MIIHATATCFSTKVPFSGSLLVTLCVQKLSKDGTPVPKHVGVATCHELCFMIYILLYCIKCLRWLI